MSDSEVLLTFLLRTGKLRWIMMRKFLLNPEFGWEMLEDFFFKRGSGVEALMGGKSWRGD